MRRNYLLLSSRLARLFSRWLRLEAPIYVRLGVKHWAAAVGRNRHRADSGAQDWQRLARLPAVERIRKRPWREMGNGILCVLKNGYDGGIYPIIFHRGR